MNNITETFGNLFHPVGALLIYKADKEMNNSGVYVEAYDIGVRGNPINAHPLSVRESMALAKALDVSQELGRSFLRPKGLMPTEVLHINPDNNGFVVWQTPAMNANLFFKGELCLPDGSYPIPAMIWKADREKLSVFAFKDKDSLSPDTPLYDAPYFNLYDDGKVCMGDVRISFKEVSCLEEFMERWQQYFFNSKFSHLIKTRSPVKGSIIQLYQSLAGKKRKFPQSSLMKNSYTLKKLIR
jgi:PRTRC genetic system protein B